MIPKFGFEIGFQFEHVLWGKKLLWIVRIEQIKFCTFSSLLHGIDLQKDDDFFKWRNVLFHLEFPASNYVAMYQNAVLGHILPH